MPLRQIPNLLSLARLILAPLIYICILQQHESMALVIFLLAGISDGLDGYLAKRFHWQSRIGSLLDPIADKILLLSCLTALWQIHALPGWLLAMALIRDLLILIAAGLQQRRHRPARIEPSLASKLNTVVQILLCLVVLADLSYPMPILTTGSQILILLTASTILWSGLGYLHLWQKATRTAA